MLEFGTHGSSSPQKLLHFEVLNNQMYPDTSMAGIGWTRNALATPSSRFTTSPSADSCRFMRTIALHTWDKPRILFHKYEKITNSVDHMDTTAHTAHFYKPHMNSIDNVLHWTCDQACLTTATYVVCECACCHLTQIYSYIFLEQGCFCRVMQQRFFPLRCQHLPCAHTGSYSYFTSHINWSYSTIGQVQLGLKNR